MNGYINRYIAQGYSIFPCNPDKSPAIAQGFLRATNDIDIVSKQFYKDDLLIGLPTGIINRLLVIDFDLNKLIPGTNDIDTRSVDELIDHVKENHGDLPDTFSVETPSGGRHLYYLLPEGVEIRSGSRFIDKFLPIDIRCEGGYVVAPDGVSYTLYDDVDELDIENLQERCAPLPQWVIESRNKSPEVEIVEYQEENLPQSEVLEIRSALAFLDSDDYVTWYQVGMALKSTGSPSAKGLYHDWSAKSDKYDPAQCEKKWREVTPRDITIASLFHIAKGKGWFTTYQNTPVPLPNTLEQPPIEEIDFEALKKIQQKYENKKFPKHLLRPRGLVGELIDYILEKSMYRQPVLALSSTLCAVGTLGGRKYRTEDDARTNIYCLNVAGASAGKETARKYIKEIFEACGCSNLCGTPKVSSDAAIETTMFENPAQMMPIDEIGRFLEAATSPKAPTFLTKILDVWMELYSQADQTYTCKAYADKDREKKKIDQPNLCILGTTVPKNLYEKGLSFDSATDGFLSRMMIFESYDKILRKNRKRNKLKKPPVEITDQVKALLKKPINMQPQGDLDHMSPSPQIVYKTEEAYDLLDEFDEYLYNLKVELDDNDQIYEMFGRTSQFAEQIALIVAIGMNIDDPMIDAYCMKYGIELALYLSEHMQYIIENFIARNETEHELKKTLKIIRDVGSISHEELSKKMQHLKSYEANDILSKLAAQNRITQQPVGVGENSRIMITAK